MQDIKQLLPHREPFLFVDRIEKFDDEEVIGYRRFTDKDFFFKGHFPDYPVVPGVILVETMAQCGGAGIRLAGKVDPNALFFLASVDKVKLRQQVRPGDEVKMVKEPTGQPENTEAERPGLRGRPAGRGGGVVLSVWYALGSAGSAIPY